MLRLLVTSATYRQSAVLTAELLERDPRNRWLRAGAAAAARSGDGARPGARPGRPARPKLGGPSVFPPQPDGLWQAAFNGERDYPTSTGEDRYRRGLYVFIRRTVPNPTIAMFDAPSRETCTFRRLPTNTPLQAFVTLNDPVYVEAAHALARRILREGGGSGRAGRAYALRLCLGRPPTRRTGGVARLLGTGIGALRRTLGCRAGVHDRAVGFGAGGGGDSPRSPPGPRRECVVEPGCRAGESR